MNEKSDFMSFFYNFTIFFQSRYNQIYFPKNLQPQACEDIYLPHVGIEASGGHLLKANQFRGLFFIGDLCSSILLELSLFDHLMGVK